MLSIYLLGFGVYAGLTQFNHRAYWLHLGAALLCYQGLPFFLGWLFAQSKMIDGAASLWQIGIFFAAFLLPLVVVSRGTLVARKVLARTTAAGH